MQTDQLEKTRWARIRYAKLEDETDNETLKKIRSFFAKKSLSKQLRFLLPWDHSLKDIESRYGGGFLSLFEFIRWLFFFNLVTALLILAFIMLPQFVLDLNHVDAYVKSNISVSAQVCDGIILGNITSANLTEFDIVKMKCCTTRYKDTLVNNTANDDWLDNLLDIFKGTDSVEDTFLFYGYYRNKSINLASSPPPANATHPPLAPNYYTGLAFSLITIASLLLSAATMIARLGKSTRKKIIEKLDSVKSHDLCNRLFCSWDHRVKTTAATQFYLDYTKSLYLRLLSTKLHDLAYDAHQRRQPLPARLALFAKRLLVNLLIFCLFALAGYSFIELNQLAARAKDKLIVRGKDQLTARPKDRYLILLYEYIPAILLKSINILFRQVFQRLNAIEKFKRSTSLTLLLLRTGTARIAVLLFLVITLTGNVLKIDNTCASQKNVLLQELNPSEFKINLRSEILCWESYVGQEFYKLVVTDFILQFAFLLYELTFKLLARRFKYDFFQVAFDLDTKYLDLLFIQAVFWLAIYFSPFLGVFGPVFYLIKFYTNLLSLTRLTSFSKAAKIDAKLNSAFFLILFAVFLLVLVLVGIVFTFVRPSNSCGPFSLQYADTEFSVFAEILNQFRASFPYDISRLIDLLFSYWAVFFLGVSMLLLIWFFSNYAASYKSMARELRKIINEEQAKNERLLDKLRRERNIIGNEQKKNLVQR